MKKDKNIDVLEEIKTTEKEANRTLEKAQERKSEIILEMGNKARQMEEIEMARIKREMEEAIKSFDAKADKDRERLLADKKSETENLKKSASSKVSKAVESLKKELNAFLGE